MARALSRRDLLSKGSKASAVGVAAYVIGVPAAGAHGVGEGGEPTTSGRWPDAFVGEVVEVNGRTAKVVDADEDGDPVLVTPRGFPDGWSLQVGDLVMVEPIV